MHEIVSVRGVTLLCVFNDLYISTNESLPFMKCFDNYVTLNLKLFSNGVEIFV